MIGGGGTAWQCVACMETMGCMPVFTLGKLPKQTANRAGLKAREYINSLYSFPDDDGRVRALTVSVIPYNTSCSRESLLYQGDVMV